MNLQMRIDLATKLGEYILDNTAEWQETKTKAGLMNPWFAPEFVELASQNIAKHFLQKQKLTDWVSTYNISREPKNVGLVMAGNIPLVGFHDLLCVFIAGHKAMVKLSSKDEVLIRHLVEKLREWSSEIDELIIFSEMLKGCDAYIATGSNNSARYFEYYFSKWPNIIRHNRTSVAFLEGNETAEELERLADDVHLYFGMGCRNVTKIFVPKDYDFIPLLNAFKKYNYFKDHNKYKNNYDYYLALHILNHKFYMSNESVILFESESIFSPISQLNYEFYTDKAEMLNKLKNRNDLQCVIGRELIPFGESQIPSLIDYADGVDTMKFLTNL
jgi:hypothetical protein